MVRVGLVGCGRWGENHAKKLVSLPCTFVGIADSDESKRAFAENLGTTYFKDYHELLDNVDAVTIAVPTLFHFSVATDALNAGKHVLVEKPLTLNLETAKRLMALAEEKRLILSSGYLYRFHPVVKRLKEFLEIKPHIHYLSARWIGGQNRLWMDSGAILNFGIHLVDILNFVLEDRPIRVTAKKQNLLDRGREDSAVIMLEYKNFFATLELSCVHPMKARDMWVIAGEHKFFADFSEKRLVSYRFSLGHEGKPQGSTEPTFIEKYPDAIDPLARELGYFIELVRTHDPLQYSNESNLGRENLATLQIIDRAIHSTLVGKPLHTNLDAPSHLRRWR